MPTTRLATPADAGLLATLARRTCYDAYSADAPGPDLQIHMDRHFGERQQAAELSDPATFTVVLEDDNGATGYALVGNDLVPPCVTGPDPWQVRRFYIDQVWKGRGVAQQLMAAVEIEARRRGALTLWLLAWYGNHRAQAFYRKCGFTEVGTTPFLFGNTMEEDVVMARPIVP